MATNKREQIESAASELEVLGGVIDYAEKMINEAGKRVEYEPLRRHAYGKTVVIAFYPRARTRGCTVQMQTYRDQFETLFNNGQGVTVLAVSTDPVDTIAAWAKDESFPMTFLSDREATVGQLYDVKYPAMNLLRRVLFVVGPDGRVTHVMRPFAELSQDSYVALREAVEKARAGNN